MSDPIARVADDLAALERAPVEAHPDVLEGVHRTVVAELDGLSRIGSPAGNDRGTDG